ncbi:MAG: hypothetical protein RL754_1198 [Bacteroidota bacterium]|jgi:hypothetical protein
MEVFLRIIADTNETVIREVRIKGSASLLDLHEHLYPIFGLAPGEMASFYRSNANWDQGEELPMFSMEDDMPSMENTTVESFLSDTAQGLYVYNFMDMNIFYVERVRTEEEEGFEDFVVLSSVGELATKEGSIVDPMVSAGMAGKDPSEMSQAEIEALYGLDSLDEDNKDEDEDNDDFYESYDEDYY